VTSTIPKRATKSNRKATSERNPQPGLAKLPGELNLLGEADFANIRPIGRFGSAPRVP
jgi:hypothetical protein